MENFEPKQTNNSIEDQNKFQEIPPILSKDGIDFNERRHETERISGEIKKSLDVLQNKFKMVLKFLGSPKELSDQYIRIMQIGEPARAISVAKRMLLQAEFEEILNEFSRRKANLIDYKSPHELDTFSYWNVIPSKEKLDKVMDNFDIKNEIGGAFYEALTDLEKESNNLFSQLEEYKKISF